MVKIEVNNRIIEAQEEEFILSALRRAGINVPTLCHVEGLPPSGACRLCVVEVEGPGGSSSLIPSCSFPVNEGMKIRTHSPKAIEARKTIIELLLADHPDDCLYCERNNNCELQKLAEELGVRQRRYNGAKNDYHLDTSSPAIMRDPAKCILCGKCIRVCEEIQGVSAIDFTGRGCHTIVAPSFRSSLNISSCVNCGQCVNVCPTGALVERNSIKDVVEALNDPDKYVVIQHAPAVSVSLAEEFGLKPGTDIAGIMAAAMRKIGFQRVFDTSFSADLTIMEEATELAGRIKNGGTLPMITSCSPAWIKFAETFYPDFIGNLSTCKSPQQMLGAVIKSYFAEKEEIDGEKIYSVSVMPCTAKKFEAERPEMMKNGIADIDAVLTTRELAKIIRMYGIEMNNLEPEINDMPFGTRSSAGKLFGATGGVMEAAIRSAHFLLTGSELKEPRVQQARGLNGIKEWKVKIGDLEIGCAVVSGLGNARKLLDEIKAGRDDIHFIEVMSCPGGCINGGGQPIGVAKDNVKARMQALYNIDLTDALKVSHKNKGVQELYDTYLGEPNSHKAHELLHTHYLDRKDTMK